MCFCDVECLHKDNGDESVVSLQVGQPASRTYLRYGSCPGQRHRVDRSGGVSCPLGYTAAEHSGNSDCSPLEGNPATQDGQTHSLQHRGCKMNIMKGKAHRIYELAYATMWCYQRFFKKNHF